MNSLLEWDHDAFGCIERNSFRLDPAGRTEMSTIGTGRYYSATADRRSPLTAGFQVWQTRTQQKAFWQWYHNDLRGGALPFRVSLWIWNRSRFVRAHFFGNLTTRYEDQYDCLLTAGTFEIERESIRPSAVTVDIPQEKTATCLPSRATYFTKTGVHKKTCVPTRYDFIVPPELKKAATCVPPRSDLLK